MAGNYGQNKVRLKHLDRMEQAVKLYREHKPLHEIKELMGLQSSKTVSKLLNEAATRLPVPGADAMRDRDNRTLDALQAPFQKKAETGDPAAANMCLEIIRQRDDLNGLSLSNKNQGNNVMIGVQLPHAVQKAAFEASKDVLCLPDDLLNEPLMIEYDKTVE